MRNNGYASSGLHVVGDEHHQTGTETTAGSDDERGFWERRPLDGAAHPGLPVTGHNGASRRFQQAVALGNPRRVRSAAAELPGIGIAEAAAILLVVERAEPENYERTALRWLAKLSTEGEHVGLSDVARAATALEALPRDPGARNELAEICRTSGLPEAGAVFAASASRERVLRSPVRRR